MENNNQYQESYSELLALASVRANYAYHHYDLVHGLKHYESIILYELLTHKQMSQKELIYRSGIPKQTISKGISTLNNQGCITITPDKSDKRVKYCSLTEKGRKYAQEKINPMIAKEESAISKFGKDKTALAVKLLNELTDLLCEELYSEEKEKK